MTVIGVVGDVKQAALDAPTDPHTYEAYAQLGGSPSLRIAIRGAQDVSSLAGAFRAAVWGLDRQLALAGLRTMDQVISRSTASRRFILSLIASFAGLALVLAAIGIYGVLAYSVTQRTRELGVRMALGALRSDVLRLVLGQSLRITAIGIIVGVAGSLAVTRFLQTLLFDIHPTDPPTFAGVVLLLAAVSAAASYVPARRATHVDPMVALREQ